MTIRGAVERDIPSIIDLLKLSLGEGLMPKSEAFWRWKHLDNPFGKSDVLLAFERDQLVGVRAFMRWEWKLQSRIYRAGRAVDTVTHPVFQGKGIFRDLTLKMVDQCKAQSLDFIFNTPNKKSMPGYLKMGWRRHGKMKLFLTPRLFPVKKSTDFDERFCVQGKVIPFNTAFESSHSGSLVTSVSSKMINWRYAANPNIPYYAFYDNLNHPTFLTIFRLKLHSWGTEMRICDTFSDSNLDEVAYRKQLREVTTKSGARLVTAAHQLPLLSVGAAVGPEITVLPLSTGNNVLSFDLWRPSVGDLEVF